MAHAQFPFLLHASLLLHGVDFFLAHGHYPEQDTHSLFTEALNHVHEHVKALPLILLQRVLLAVSPEADSVSQMIHVQEVVLPQAVKHLEHEETLGPCHLFRTEEFHLFRIVLFEQVAQVFFKLPGCYIFALLLGEIQPECELAL